MQTTHGVSAIALSDGIDSRLMMLARPTSSGVEISLSQRQTAGEFDRVSIECGTASVFPVRVGDRVGFAAVCALLTGDDETSRQALDSQIRAPFQRAAAAGVGPDFTSSVKIERPSSTDAELRHMMALAEVKDLSDDWNRRLVHR